MAAASEGPRGASATTEGVAEEATAETSEFIAEMLEQAYGITSEGTTVKGCYSFTAPASAGEIDLDWNAETIDLMTTYIDEDSELGLTKEYWPDATTGYTVTIYYPYGAAPRISAYTGEDDETYLGSSYLTSQYYDFNWTTGETTALTKKFNGGPNAALTILESGNDSLFDMFVESDVQTTTRHNIIVPDYNVIVPASVLDSTARSDLRYLSAENENKLENTSGPAPGTSPSGGGSY